MSARRNVQQIREKVAKYRELARMIADLETANQFLELTDELEQQDRDMERGKRHSRSASKLWCLGYVMIRRSVESEFVPTTVGIQAIAQFSAPRLGWRECRVPCRCLSRLPSSSSHTLSTSCYR